MANKGNHEDVSAHLSRVSYWLMPVAEERDRFAKLITGLAGAYGGSVFAPHLTVYSGPAAPDPGTLLPETITPGGELVLRCTGLHFSENYTKACVLTFAPEPSLNQLCESIRLNSGHPDNYLLQPHLSLFYGKLAREDRQQIRELVKLPECVRFAGLVAMATSEVIECSADVLSWRKLAELPL
jgi:hypothetical protein